MKKLTSAQLFAASKSARKTKAKLEHAHLVVAAARERAVRMAQRYAALTSTVRPMQAPTVQQRRRLAELQKKSEWTIKVTSPSTIPTADADYNPTHMAPSGFDSAE